VLHVIAFERLAVAVSDLYFVDPNPVPGQEGAERGVRLELRLAEAGDLVGSIYSARPITVDRPVWRCDLLESVEHPGSFDRTHHHPRFRGWEPCPRVFVPELSADPLGWLTAQLGDPAALVTETGVVDEVPADDLEALAEAAPEIVAVVERLLHGIAAGKLARPPATVGAAERISWL